MSRKMKCTQLKEVSKIRIKIAGRNVNNLKYANDTTLLAESKEELKSLLMKEESGKSWLKTQPSKIKIMASGLITWKQWKR